MTNAQMLAVLGISAVAGASLVAVPTARAVIVGLIAIAVVWLVVLPRGWMADVEPTTRRVILVFLGLRLVMPLVFQLASSAAALLFSGGSDSLGYHRAGAHVATELVATGHSISHRQIPGTGAIDLAVGYFYAWAAPVRIVGDYAWSALATIGMLLFWWATNHLAGERRSRYTAFVLLTPTLLLWNAGLSKEAPMTFATGCIVAGVYMLSVRSNTLRGVGYLTIGVAVAGFVRPHVALLLLLGTVVGVGAPRLKSKTKPRRLLPLAVGVVFLAAIVPATQALINPTGKGSLVDAAYDSAEKTAVVGGRSSFETSPTRSVGDVPFAVVTVLFRPFPWEVRTAPQLLASGEAMVVFAMVVGTLRGLAKRRLRLVRSPLVFMSATFALLFCLAFASLGNFGLLVRERMQVLPFVVVLVFSVRPIASRTSAKATLVNA